MSAILDFARLGALKVIATLFFLHLCCPYRQWHLSRGSPKTSNFYINPYPFRPSLCFNKYWEVGQTQNLG